VAQGELPFTLRKALFTPSLLLLYGNLCSVLHTQDLLVVVLFVSHLVCPLKRPDRPRPQKLLVVAGVSTKCPQPRPAQVWSERARPVQGRSRQAQPSQGSPQTRFLTTAVPSLCLFDSPSPSLDVLEPRLSPSARTASSPSLNPPQLGTHPSLAPPRTHQL
jgi:hypothetical protein